MGTMTQERTYFGPILDAQTADLEGFRPEDFRPCPGTVLVVTPPPITTTKKGIILPDSAIGMPTWGIVAAIPGIPRREEDGYPPDCEDGPEPRCPVQVGDRVVFREGAGTPVAFQDRKDLLLLQYTAEADSEIMGRFPVCLK